jgi:hypothetical protein
MISNLITRRRMSLACFALAALFAGALIPALARRLVYCGLGIVGVGLNSGTIAVYMEASDFGHCMIMPAASFSFEWLPRVRVTPGRTIFVVHFPIWLLVGASVLAGCWLWRRPRSRSAHCCQTCSYDVTGNVSGVCPECGRELPQKGDATP